MIDPERLAPEVQKVMRRLANDLPYFCRKAITIKTKSGELKKLEFNKAQWYLHTRAEDQKRRTGKVRRIVVKGRQMGGSEYIAARGYHFAIMNMAKTVYILSHEAKSTQVLFAKVDRYHRFMIEQLRLGERTANKHEKKFDNESEYGLGTAGAENTGRSNTAQFLHLSEPAHYPAGADRGIKSGLLQVVAEADGTEIWMETTANGMNWFYDFVIEAMKPGSEWEIDFLPWYWDDQYRAEVPEDFVREDDEQELVDLYGLDDEQLFWRRRKIATLGLRLFRQEYPCTLMEAFQSPKDSFYTLEDIERAKKSVLRSTFGPVIIGCDPGRTGDRTIIAIRQGREVKKLIKYENMDQMRLAGILSRLIDEWDADKCFIDWGMGHGTIDRLHERGYRMVEGVNFGGSADEEQYANKRAEMNFAFRDWLRDGEVNLPDDNEMTADIMMLPDSVPTSNGKHKFPSKEEMRKEFNRSPDILDALILTFAYPVFVTKDGAGAVGNTRPIRNTAREKYGDDAPIMQRVRQQNQVPTSSLSRPRKGVYTIN